MIYSGLDWSGSPGNEHGPWLEIAIAHVDEDNMPKLDAELARIRDELRLSPDFPFRHSETTARTKSAFFAAVRRVPLTVHGHMLDKAAWSAQYVSGSSGFDCICDGIITLLARCPRHVVDRQILYIDLPRRDGKLVERYRTTIRQALRRAKHPAFRDLKPRPDHRQDAAIIQVADMVAGEIRAQAGIAGPYLPSLGSRIQMVQESKNPAARRAFGSPRPYPRAGTTSRRAKTRTRFLWSLSRPPGAAPWITKCDHKEYGAGLAC
ncbi:MAG: hypothetical protein ACRDJC_09045 [Thermomicrobiales bacterium]